MRHKMQAPCVSPTVGWHRRHAQYAINTVAAELRLLDAKSHRVWETESPEDESFLRSMIFGHIQTKMCQFMQS